MIKKIEVKKINCDIDDGKLFCPQDTICVIHFSCLLLAFLLSVPLNSRTQASLLPLFVFVFTIFRLSDEVDPC